MFSAHDHVVCMCGAGTMFSYNIVIIHSKSYS